MTVLATRWSSLSHTPQNSQMAEGRRSRWRGSGTWKLKMGEEVLVLWQQVSKPEQPARFLCALLKGLVRTTYWSSVAHRSSSGMTMSWVTPSPTAGDPQLGLQCIPRALTHSLAWKGPGHPCGPLRSFPRTSRAPGRVRMVHLSWPESLVLGP